MKSSIRPTTIDDLNKVRGLLQRSFNTTSSAPFLEQSVMVWKYWEHRDDWHGPRSYVLEQNGIIVAHAGLYPLTFHEGQVQGVHLIDWASAKESPGAGFALLKRIESMFDFTYGIGGSEITQKILSALGYIRQAKQWKAVRPVLPLYRILKAHYRDWKIAPRFVRNSLLASLKAAQSPVHGDWTCAEIAPSEISTIFYSKDEQEQCFSPRPPAFFEYLLSCPVMKIRLYGIHNNRGPKGHFAIGVLRGQARLAGVWLREPDAESWQAAFALAQQAAARLEGACEILAAGTEGPSELGALRSGLRMVEYSPVYMLNRTGRKVPNNFQFQLSDNDGFFLDLN